MFMSKQPPVKRTLADIIMEKITEKQTEIRTQMSGKYSKNLKNENHEIMNILNKAFLFSWITLPTAL